MSQSAKPSWPDPAALLSLFGGRPAAPAAVAPLSQGLATGMDLISKFWGNLPGGSAVPGFLVPTLDVGELDKRVSDLRAAEQWLEVNLNMLRATIQGLEVQRNTIAALQSLSAMTDKAHAMPSTAAPVGGLPAGWPMASAPATPPAPPPEPEPTPPPVEAAPAPEPVAAPEGGEPVAGLAGLAANNWLGFMQEQFTKVAQAALATSPATSERPASTVAKAPARKTTRKPAAKKAARRRSAPG